MLTVVCNCLCLQQLAVDVLTTLCCLNHSACGRRARQRWLASSGNTSGTIEKSLIGSISAANRVARLRALQQQQPSQPSCEGRIHRHSLSNSNLLLSEKSDPIVNDRDVAAPPASPLASAEVGGAVENAVYGSEIATKRPVLTKRDEDASYNKDDCGIEEKPPDVTGIDRKRSKSKASEVRCPAMHTMLVVVTADVVAATAQIGESDRGRSTVEVDGGDDDDAV